MSQRLRPDRRNRLLLFVVAILSISSMAAADEPSDIGVLTPGFDASDPRQDPMVIPSSTPGVETRMRLEDIDGLSLVEARPRIVKVVCDQCDAVPVHAATRHGRSGYDKGCALMGGRKTCGALSRHPPAGACPHHLR